MKLTYIKTNLRRYTFENKKIKEWVEGNCVGNVLNLFAGNTKLDINEFRVDIDKNMLADVYSDALEFLKTNDKKFDTAVLDPPYSYRKSMEMYNGNYQSRFKQVADHLIDCDRVISFGYHSTFMGAVRGYELQELCVFGHGGSQHCTIGIVEIKKHIP